MDNKKIENENWKLLLVISVNILIKDFNCIVREDFEEFGNTTDMKMDNRLKIVRNPFSGN